MDQCDTSVDLSSIYSDLYFMVQFLYSCLEDYLLQKSCLGMIDQCHSEIDLDYIWVSDLYLMVN